MTATNEMLSNSEIRYNYLISSIPDVIGELGVEITGTARAAPLPSLRKDALPGPRHRSDTCSS